MQVLEQACLRGSGGLIKVYRLTLFVSLLLNAKTELMAVSGLDRL